MTFQAGSNVQLTHGIIQFNGSASANLTNHSAATQIYGLEIYKTHPANLTIASASTQPFTVNSGIFNYTGSTLINNYSGTITLKGTLTIQSGVLYPQTHTINIGGNWSNLVGPAAFNEGNARVIFNGSGHQYCYTETFNILEVNKSGGALRVDSSTAVVTIAQYDWTAGAVDVLTGTLTIDDLYDNGMYGGFYCTSGGLLNITQDSAQGIDLYGTL